MNDKKQNYLASAEMSDEGNYNMIDGIINNIPKPSLLEQIKEYERRIAENKNGKTDTDADKKKLERSEQEKEDL